MAGEGTAVAEVERSGRSPVRAVDRRAIARACLLALTLAAVMVAARVANSDPAAQHQTRDTALTTLYLVPRTNLQASLNQHDGQNFAALAMDPALKRPEVFGGPANEAYRAARPLLGWLAWIGSAGQPGAVPWALAVLTVIGAAVLVAGAGMVASAWNRDLSRLVLVLVLPGAFVQFAWIGLSDNIATGLVLAGLALWSRRRTTAVALFVAAALTRETTLVVPAAIAVAEAVRWLRPGAAPGSPPADRRRRPSDLAGRLATLALPFVVYGAWIAVVRWRLGAYPSDAGGGRLGGPGNGLLTAARDLWSSPLEPVVLVATVVLIVVGLARRPPMAGTLAIAFSALLALLLGWNVWERWGDFTRVLLPATVLALVAILPRARRTPGRAPGGRDAVTTPVSARSAAVPSTTPRSGPTPTATTG